MLNIELGAAIAARLPNIGRTGTGTGTGAVAVALAQPAGAPNGRAAFPTPAPARLRALAADLRRDVALLGLLALDGPTLVRSRCCNAPPGCTEAPPRPLVPPRWCSYGPGGAEGLRALSVFVSGVIHGY
jgi:hypothetical protein